MSMLKNRKKQIKQINNKLNIQVCSKEFINLEENLIGDKEKE